MNPVTKMAIAHIDFIYDYLIISSEGWGGIVPKKYVIPTPPNAPNVWDRAYMNPVIDPSPLGKQFSQANSSIVGFNGKIKNPKKIIETKTK